MANTLPADSNAVVYEGLRDASGQQFVAKMAGTVTVDGGGIKSAPQAVAPTNQPKAGYVALSAPPSATTAGADTTLTFSSQVNHWLLQNNTSAALAFELDATSNAGSIQLASGAVWTSDIPVTAVHVYTASAQNVNGTASGNIVLRGWL